MRLVRVLAAISAPRSNPVKLKGTFPLPPSPQSSAAQKSFSTYGR